MNNSNNPWLISSSSKSKTALRLFCFHPAGSGASLFRPWFKLVPPDIEVWAVQLPGRENRLKEPLFTDLFSLIPMLTEAIVPYLQECLFAFFGHSLGALVSFELARQLRRETSLSPLHLFVSSRRAPHIHLDKFLYNQSDSRLMEALDEFGGTPKAILPNPEIMQLCLRIFRADLTLTEAYIYKPGNLLNTPITVFGATDDNSVTQEQLFQWSQYTTQDFDIQMFPGDHMFFKDNPEPLVNAIFQHLYISKLRSISHY